jgi:hypothetical protein
MKFTRCKIWTWKRFFTGEMSIATNPETTEEQVREQIEKRIGWGGSGNWDPRSLTVKETKIKTKKLKLEF